MYTKSGKVNHGGTTTTMFVTTNLSRHLNQPQPVELFTEANKAQYQPEASSLGISNGSK